MPRASDEDWRDLVDGRPDIEPLEEKEFEILLANGWIVAAIYTWGDDEIVSDTANLEIAQGRWIRRQGRAELPSPPVKWRPLKARR